MDVKEAPEKIYMKPSFGEPENVSIAHFSKSQFDFNIGIEYTRTDAFIEKAKKWFEEHFGNRLKWEITTYEFEDMQSMVEDFKNYIKGE